MNFDQKILRAYLVGGTQDTENDVHRFLTRVEAALAAGVTAFQYREKGNSRLTAAQTTEVAARLRELTARYRVPYFIDDDEELALAVGADGVHVGQKDQRIERVIDRAAGRLLIGYSCNTPAQIARANQLAAVEYVGIRPIFPTRSKVDADPALGLARLKALVQESTHPVVAIGGLTADKLAATRQTGVAGLAVISLVLASDSIPRAVRQLRGNESLAPALQSGYPRSINARKE